MCIRDSPVSRADVCGLLGSDDGLQLVQHGLGLSLIHICWFLGWSRNCCWRFRVQLSSQLESLPVTMPPVTVWPLKGSRLQIFLIYWGILSLSLIHIYGHSHTVMANKQVTDASGKAVTLTQTGSYFKNIGKMTALRCV